MPDLFYFWEEGFFYGYNYGCTMAEVSKADLDGLGVRVNKMSVVLAKTEERSENNEENIKTLTTQFETKSQQFSNKADKISHSVIIGACILVAGLFLKEIFTK